MRRMLSVAAVLAAGLLVPSTADAAISSVFGSQISCAVQPSGQRFCGAASGAGRVASWDNVPIDTAVAFPPAPAAGADGPYPVIGIYHGWGGSKLALTGADAQRALSRGYAVFTMTDRGWGQSCGQQPSRADTRLRERLHPAHAQRVRGARRAVPARPARRRRRDRPAEDRRDRRLLRRRHVDRARRAAQPRAAPERHAGAVDEPARQADEHRRHRAPVHLERPDDRAEPERQLARLRRRRAVPRRRPPVRHPEAELERLAVPRRPVPRLLRAGGQRSLGRHRRLEGADRHRRPLRRQSGRGRARQRAHRQPLGLLHRRLGRARAGAARQRLERRSVPGRRVDPLLQQGPRQAPERADVDVPPRLRAQPARGRGVGGRRRGADGGDQRVAGLLRQGRRLRARGRAWRRRHPHLEVPGQHRRRALSRADVGPARPGRDPDRGRRGADDRRARHRRRRTRSRPATSARRPRAPTTRRPRPTACPPATSAYTLAGSPTIIAKLAVVRRQRHGRGASV